MGKKHINFYRLSTYFFIALLCLKGIWPEPSKRDNSTESYKEDLPAKPENAMKTIGILGGMGPQATALFYEKILKLTEANSDQEHIPTLIYSNTQIPNRNNSIQNSSTKKLIKELQSSAKTLERAGAHFIVIPCNTAHIFAEEVQNNIKIPLLNIIEETAFFLKNENQSKTIGILGTTSTVNSLLYHKAIEANGMKIIQPEDAEQAEIMELINAIKGGAPLGPIRIKMETFAKHLVERGADRIILGCTEIPLLFQENQSTYLIDPMDILARRATSIAKGTNLKNS